MKPTTRLIVGAAWVAVLAYGIYATVRIRHLEATLLTTPRPPSYAFDDSFIHSFGQPGVDAVNRAIGRGVTDPEHLAREVTLELKQK